MGSIGAMLARAVAVATAVVAVLGADAAAAAELHGRVVRVTDGDTVVVLDGAREQHKVRVQGIDAPERAQPFSDRSKQQLSRLVFGRDVVVRWDKRDRYGRIVGTVLAAKPGCDEPACAKTVDAGLAQVKAGLAWWYRQYAKEQTPAERKAYEAAEGRARKARRGLWSQPEPTPPWAFRRAKRSR